MITDQLGTMEAARNSGGSVKLKPMGLFTDGAVLQRGRRLPVWGTAAGKRRITVRLGALERQTYSAADGSFYIEFPPQEATSTPLTMTFSDGTESVTVKDIVIGDVFHISGQSNMQFALCHCEDKRPVCDWPLREYRVGIQAIPGGARDVDGHWITPDDAASFSGIGFFFAAEYARLNHVPVGLIDTSIGGISGEAFASKAELKKIPALRQLMNRYDENLWTKGWCDETANGTEITPKSALMRHITDAMQPLPPLPDKYRDFMKPDYDDSSWLSQDLPDSWSVVGFVSPGTGLYRRKISLPDEFLGKPLKVSLGACDCADECYVNGELIGQTGIATDFATWNTPRIYDIPAVLNSRPELVLAVKVSTLCSVATYGGMTGPEDAMFLSCADKRLPLSGPWQMAMAVQTDFAPMESMSITGAGEPKSFHCLFDSMIRPLAPYALAGALFYQGEANTLCHPELYGAIVEAIANSWRTAWEDDQMPFIVMTLPGFQRCHPYTASSPWARIRDEQFRASMKACGHAPVNLADCGDVYNIHPPLKHIPGARAAQAMTAVIQGRKPLAATWLTGITAAPDGWTLTFAETDSELLSPDANRCVIGISADGTAIPLETVKAASFVLKASRPAHSQIVMLTNGWSENPTDSILKTANDVAIFPFRREV